MKVKVAKWSELEDRAPAYALVGNVDLVVVRYDDEVSVLSGRCQHRDALMADGFVDGDNLICGLHGWDYRYDTGVSEYNNAERLEKFTAVVDRDGDAVLVDADEVAAFIATQKEHLRARLVIEQSAKRLQSFFEATVELMKLLARACGHHHLRDFEHRDLTTWKRDIADLTGVRYGGVGAS